MVLAMVVVVVAHGVVVVVVVAAAAAAVVAAAADGDDEIVQLSRCLRIHHWFCSLHATTIVVLDCFFG